MYCLARFLFPLHNRCLCRSLVNLAIAGAVRLLLILSIKKNSRGIFSFLLLGARECREGREERQELGKPIKANTDVFIFDFRY